jgi:hypothetical protein
MGETLAAAARFANTRSSLWDLLRAKFLLDNQGLSPSPLTLLHSVDEIIGFLEDNPGTAAWLAETLHGEAASMLRSSAWFEKNRAALSGAQGESAGIGGEIETFGRLRFKEIISSEPMENFFIAEAPISAEAWELFLNDRPEWSKDNREALINEGLVNSQYLASVELPGLPGNTMAGVSWFAAQAWCEWYSSKLPALIARLPLEAEWELAAKTGLEKIGEFWEWCEDPFVPLNFLPSAFVEFVPESPERPVRGGSWINRRSIEIDTIASLPPDS